MLDVPGIRIVRMNSLKMRSQSDLRIEGCGIYRDGSIRGRTLLRRKTGRAVVSCAAWFRTVQIAAEPGYRSAPSIAPRLLTTIRQFRHRARTFLLMRTNATHQSEHNDHQACRCEPLSYHCRDYS